MRSEREGTSPSRRARAQRYWMSAHKMFGLVLALAACCATVSACGSIEATADAGDGAADSEISRDGVAVDAPGRDESSVDAPVDSSASDGGTANDAGDASDARDAGAM